jgi:hypothetical protein
MRTKAENVKLRSFKMPTTSDSLSEFVVTLSNKIFFLSRANYEYGFPRAPVTAPEQFSESETALARPPNQSQHDGFQSPTSSVSSQTPSSANMRAPGIVATDAASVACINRTPPHARWKPGLLELALTSKAPAPRD